MVFMTPTKGEARDRVGRALGMSGRNLGRYLRVLKTPVAVQNAFRAGYAVACNAQRRVADLEKKAQGSRCRTDSPGEAPKEVDSGVSAHT